jgi:phosphatidylglycerol:prolipoprotein diacylglycerol transferase
MYPIIYNYKMLTIGGYGIMLGLAFYLGFLLAEREFKLRGKDPELTYTLLFWVIPSAIIGAKIFHIMENFEEFLADIPGMIFSGAGLSVYGGFILAFIVSIFIIRRAGENVLEIFDIAAPTMALGYGLGRIGCHVAGDGCYGIETASLLGMAYPNGIVPSTAAVFPTSLFEALFSLTVFFFLMQYRKAPHKTGHIFFLYLILNGTARFFVEFIRVNPDFISGFTHAQVIAVLFILTGIAGLVVLKKGLPFRGKTAD